MSDNNWVLVNDRQPETGLPVLVYHHGDIGVFSIREIEWSRFNGVRWEKYTDKAWYPGGLPLCNSSHWMPLPDPPVAA